MKRYLLKVEFEVPEASEKLALSSLKQTIPVIIASFLGLVGPVEVEEEPAPTQEPPPKAA